MTQRPYTFDRVIRILFALIGVVAALWFIDIIKSALLPFLVAWLLAYLLNPLVNFFQIKLRFKNRILSVFSAILSILLVVSIGIALLIQPIGVQIEHLTQAIAKLEASSGDQSILPKELIEYITLHLNIKEISQLITIDDLRNLIATIVPKIASFINDTFNLIISVVASMIALIYLVFILIDYERISHGWLRLVPVKYRNIVSTVASDVQIGMNRYFRGQALVAFLVGVLLSIGFTLIGLPMGIFLGLFIGLLNMIPYLQVVGILPMAVLCFLKSVESGNGFMLTFGLALLVLGIVQIIQDTILVPRIMGKVTGLNPAVILLSLSVWGTLMGLIGMIIALPMTTLLLSYYQRFILTENEVPEEEIARSHKVDQPNNPN